MVSVATACDGVFLVIAGLKGVTCQVPVFAVTGGQIVSGLKTAALSGAGLLIAATIAALAVHPGSKPDKTS